MTIQSGRFGQKNSHPGLGAPVSTRASERRKVEEAVPATKGGAADAIKSDAFELGAARAKIIGSPQAQVAEVSHEGETFAAADRQSQVANVVGAFEERNVQLLGQFNALRQKARNLVDTMGERSFDQAAVSDTRQELTAVREEMAKVRGRMHRNSRRMKLLRSGARSASPLDGNKLQKRLTKVASAKGQAQTAVQLLRASGDLNATSVGKQALVRLPLGGGSTIDRHALGEYLAQLAPFASLAQLTTQLVAGGERRPTHHALHRDVRHGRLGKELEQLAALHDATVNA